MSCHSACNELPCHSMHTTSTYNQWHPVIHQIVQPSIDYGYGSNPRLGRAFQTYTDNSLVPDQNFAKINYSFILKSSK